MVLGSPGDRRADHGVGTARASVGAWATCCPPERVGRHSSIPHCGFGDAPALGLTVDRALASVVDLPSGQEPALPMWLFWHAHLGSHLGSHMLEPTVLHCRSVPFSGSHGRGVQGSLATESSWQALAFTRCCAAVPRGLALVVLRLPGRYTCFDCSLLPVPGQHGSSWWHSFDRRQPQCQMAEAHHSCSTVDARTNPGRRLCFGSVCLAWL